MLTKKTIGARLKQPTEKMDLPFFTLVLCLAAIGVLMVFSASYARSYNDYDSATYYAGRQLIFAVVGIVGMLLISRIPYEFWRRMAPVIYIVSAVLMLFVIFMGSSSHGATRWISVGGVKFQPSEIAKLAIILLLSKFAAQSREKMKDWKYVGKFFLLPLIGMLLLTIFERHISATIIIAALGFVIIFLAGGKSIWFAALFALAALGAFILIKISDAQYAIALENDTLDKLPYYLQRIIAWRHTWDIKLQSDISYQVVQSIYAIGSGGFLGLGFGLSRQKYLYLPEEHNDYIFAIVCEELGFVGAAVIVLLYMLLILRGYWIALHAKNRFAALVAASLTTLIAIQVVLNIGVVTNLLPSTGISLPFFSYGGTALMMQLGEMGIVLNISRECDSTITLQEEEPK